MIALEQAGQHLEILGPAQAVEVIDNNPDATASEQLAYPAMPEQLLWGEVEAHGERYLSIRARMAHFPFRRTPEQFDFASQPSVCERQIEGLAGLVCQKAL